MYIYNSIIYPMARNKQAPFAIEKGFVRIENGVITEVSAGNPDAVADEDIDGNGGVLMPGLIDIHTHMGIIGDGEGAEGDDVNEFTDPITPHLRAIDAVNGMDRCFSDAIQAGVTSVVTGCGSTNPIGGDMILVKTFGKRIDDMFVKTVGIKFALGENPKGCYSDRDEFPATRMSTAAAIREALKKAIRYNEACESAEEQEDLPEYDIKSEGLIPLIKGEIPAHFHCHRLDDIFTAMRISKEFDLKHFLVHCTEGHLGGDILGAEGESAVLGPIICDRGKPELRNLTVENPAILYNNGVKVALCTDHPEIPIQYLPMSAAVSVKNGLPYEEGLRAVTINAAEIIGAEDKIGSIEVGKDADLTLFDGDPLNIMTSAKVVIINGKVVFSK